MNLATVTSTLDDLLRRGTLTIDSETLDGVGLGRHSYTRYHTTTP